MGALYCQKLLGLMGLAAIAHNQEEAQHRSPQGGEQGDLQRIRRTRNQHDQAGDDRQNDQDDEPDGTSIRLRTGLRRLRRRWWLRVRLRRKLGRRIIVRGRLVLGLRGVMRARHAH